MKPTEDLILAFESSCDDTSVAILDTQYHILSNIISSQVSHNDFGGILPELASRLHLKNILYLTETAIQTTAVDPARIAAIAVSINPGLIGSLIVGLSFAKGLAWSMNIPLITVNHLLAHIFANYIGNPDLKPPYAALVVSGGHTELVCFNRGTEFQVIGKTLDDAAGETFDKAAKLLGLPFPGGPVIDQLAQSGNSSFLALPRALNRKDDHNFSFSGLKTAIKTHLANQDENYIRSHINDLAASIQTAIIEPLVNKTVRWCKNHHIPTILLAGGVAANSLLRQWMPAAAGKHGIRVYCPPVKLCLDNAAMVAAAAVTKYRNGKFSTLDVNAFSTKGTKEI
ncbi:MAG: tRNA (adenosine(37)-N6)-threonylcarbamoyltransferase complex transferase subunit TsaD [Candidatus Cloacimonetes bacterium]|nr:tRNA (adenosine(37)-N6)-threonylcarbamoyltransferase complex transferase subunit TsaD [Candidatus Cloacimonadota bacterium]